MLNNIFLEFQNCRYVDTTVLRIRENFSNIYQKNLRKISASVREERVQSRFRNMKKYENGGIEIMKKEGIELEKEQMLDANDNSAYFDGVVEEGVEISEYDKILSDKLENAERMRAEEGETAYEAEMEEIREWVETNIDNFYFDASDSEELDEELMAHEEMPVEELSVIHDERFRQCLATGESKGYYENGNLKFELSKNGDKLSGTCKIYFEDGKLESEVHYHKDKLEGICKDYHMNGNVDRVMNFKNGKLEGEAICYYQNGQVESEAQFIHDELNGIVKEYYENGILQSVATYKNGALDGVAERYYPNGKSECVEIYRDNMLDGKNEYYYENGKVHQIAEIRGKQLDGIYMMYGEDGTLEVHEIYSQGALVDKIK